MAEKIAQCTAPVWQEGANCSEGFSWTSRFEIILFKKNMILEEYEFTNSKKKEKKVKGVNILKKE